MALMLTPEFQLDSMQIDGRTDHLHGMRRPIKSDRPAGPPIPIMPWLESIGMHHLRFSMPGFKTSRTGTSEQPTASLVLQPKVALSRVSGGRLSGCSPAVIPTAFPDPVSSVPGEAARLKAACGLCWDSTPHAEAHVPDWSPYWGDRGGLLLVPFQPGAARPPDRCAAAPQGGCQGAEARADAGGKKKSAVVQPCGCAPARFWETGSP